MNKLFYIFGLLLTANILFTACSEGEEPVNPDKPGNNNPRREDYDNGYYIGEFNDKGERHGQGTYYWNTGDKYEGQWENGNRKGYGEMTYANGDIYKGNWENSLRHGKGTLFYKSGAKYDGNWENGNASGYGEMLYANGGIYKGNWKNSERAGQGEMIYANGDSYNGNWENDKRSGQGTLTYKNDGTTFTCQWKDDSPTDEKCYLLWTMKSWYYWNRDMSKVDVTQYTSAEDMLDKLKRPEDKLSAITTLGNNTTNDIFFEGKELGYGLGVRWDADDELRVAWVHEDSPANLYGIKRGWKVSKINNTDVHSMTSINLTPANEGSSMTFTFEDEKGVSKTTALSAKAFKIQSVLYKNTYQLPNKKTGYIVLQSFAQQNADEIKQNINTLVSSGIQELILDLRYCAGGNYVLLNEFANVVFPASANNKTFMTRKYNQDRQANDTAYIIQKTGTLNLDRIFVLSTSSTYNLGEYLPVNLKPYTKVIQIGTKTNGTAAYGTSYWTFAEKKRHTLITSLLQNANGESCLGGITPDYAAFDGVDKNWGDENEELLKNALYFITNGYFPLSLRSAGKVQRQQEANKKIGEICNSAEAVEINEKQLIVE